MRPAVVTPGVRRFVSAAAVLAVAIGAVVLIGWWFQVPRLTNLLMTRVAMKANTAAGLCLLGVARLLLSRSQASMAHGRPWVAVFPAIAGLTGLLTLLEYLAGVDLGIDQVLAREVANPVDTFHPGRMSVVTALSFLLLGAVGVAEALGRFGAWSRRACTGTMAIAFFSLILHLYGTGLLVGWLGGTAMAIHTAIALILLACGTLLAHPEQGYAAILLSGSPGGESARRLLFWVVLLPAIGGWARLQGEGYGLYGREFGTAALNTLLVVSMGWAVLWSAGQLEAADIVRRGAERRTREGELLLKTVLDATSWMVSVKDASGRFILVNRNLAALFRRSAESMIGLSAADFLPKEQAERSALEERRVLESGSPSVVEQSYLLNGESRAYLVSKSVLRNLSGEAAGVVMVAVDVNDHHNRQVELERVNAELRAVTDQLRESIEESRAFAYSVSHDLRAPLRAMDGFTRALEEDVTDGLSDEARSHLARIRAASRKMGELIDGLLILSRVTQADMVVEPVDLSRVCAGCVETLRAADPSREVAVAVAPGLSVRGDIRLLRSAIGNLIGNAWKFTARSPGARVDIGSFIQADGVRVFYVRDNGAGFDPAYAAKLFVPFERLHPRGEFDGMGIGLATAARIVRRHGGRIWAESSPNHGATFYFTLGEEPITTATGGQA